MVTPGVLNLHGLLGVNFELGGLRMTLGCPGFKTFPTLPSIEGRVMVGFGMAPYHLPMAWFGTVGEVF